MILGMVHFITSGTFVEKSCNLTGSCDRLLFLSQVPVTQQVPVITQQVSITGSCHRFLLPNRLALQVPVTQQVPVTDICYATG